MMLFISCCPRASVRSHRHHADGVTTPRPGWPPDADGLFERNEEKRFFWERSECQRMGFYTVESVKGF
jgi:hypothetical protein